LGTQPAQPAPWQIQRATALREIAAHLGGQVEGGSAFVKIHGVTILVRYPHRDSEVELPRPWTEIYVEVPRSYPLAIHVRRRSWLDQGHIARGEMIAIRLGDPAFDDAFLVEAVPEDVARSLLDGDARAFLSAHGRAELDTVTEGELRFLRFAVSGWIAHAATVTTMIDQVAQIGARVREAYVDVERPASPQVGGSPYRSELAEQPVRDASAARAAEVAALDASRASRAHRARRQQLIVLAVLGVFVLTSLTIGIVARQVPHRPAAQAR
jgi:hypothetical protein